MACEGSPAGAQGGALALPVGGTFVVIEKTSSPIITLQLCPNAVSYHVLHTCLLKEAASTTVMSSGVPSSVVSKLERPYLANEGEGSAVSAMQISKYHILSTS